MKRRAIGSLLLISAMLFATGCAQKEVVKKENTIVPATSPGRVGSPNEILSQAKNSSSANAEKTVQQIIATTALYFGFNEYVLSDESKKTIQSIYKILESKPYIQIEGHCDERGSSEYNLALGEKRAKAARNYLVTLGYPDDKLSTISYGKERPADKGNNEAAWAKNRRDVFVIVKEK